MIVITVILLLLAGLIIGVSGIGGFLFPPMAMSLFNIGVRESIATCLGGFIILSSSGSMIYLRNGHVNKKYVYLILIGAVPGVLAGLAINVNINEMYLGLSLAALLLAAGILLAIQWIRGRLKPAAPELYNEEKPELSFINGKYALVTAGAIGGIMAGFMGVGGPIVTIPFMVYVGYLPKVSVGSSMFSCIFIVAFAFLAHLSYTSVNYVYVFLIGGLGALGTWVGAMLADKIKQESIRLVVAVVSLLSAVYIIYNL